MMKRNLAAALAVLAISGAVVPMTANAATAEPYNIVNTYELSHDVLLAWSCDNGEGTKNLDIARKENESDYDYYNRIRDFVAANWTITTEVPTTVVQATGMANAHKVDNARFYMTLGSVLDYKSDLMYDFRYYIWNDPAWSSEKYGIGGMALTRYTEMTNEYGQKQTIPSMLIHNCVEEHKWWEKDVFGVVRLDGKLYAMKMTTDSSTCGTLIPYEELGYKNCDLHWEWNTNVLKARGYQPFTCKEVKWKHLQIYDADMSYNESEAEKTWSQWGVQGVLSYYCENGKITPMTKALNDTLPWKDTNEYIDSETNIRPNGWKVFAE